MNYRHLFHAGNFADVLKHAALALLIEALKAKDKPFVVFDTHAGRGAYDLMSDEALRNPEYRGGIAKVLGADGPHLAPLKPYLDLVRQQNATEPSLRRYPGSPLIAQGLMRPDDRLVLVEKHPEEFAGLRRAMGRDARVHLHEGDGYERIEALLPPPERRGLVLIDPPFEIRDEFDHFVRALVRSHRRFPAGVFMGWYPIKAPAAIAAFHGALKQAGLRRLVALEVMIQAPRDPARLNGNGLVLINPPFAARKALESLPGLLAPILGTGHGASGRFVELVGE